MKRKILIFCAILLVLAGVTFYFRVDLANFYYRLTQKVAAIDKASVGPLIQELKDQINAPSPLIGGNETSGSFLTKAGVIRLTNIQRAENGGLPALTENAKLDAAALAKAQDMFKNQYFEHVSPSGIGPAQVVQNAGYSYIAAGENLAMGNFKDDFALVVGYSPTDKSWMNSPGHRANILNKSFKEIGVAVVKGIYQGQTTWMAVQEFGLPSSACPSPSAALKIQVDSITSQLDSLESQINALLPQIKSNKFQSRDNYNNAVTQYNNLVTQYNSLVAQRKKSADIYDAQVNKYNLCINQ